MPVYKNNLVLEIVRNIKMFLNLEAGVTRDVTLRPGIGTTDRGVDTTSGSQKRADLHRQLTQIKQENAELRARVSEPTGNLEANTKYLDNIVWIFGSGRSGSTWLSSMMRDMQGYISWGEPLIGKLFADLYYSSVAKLNFENEHFIFATQHKEAWTKSIRVFVTEGARARFPEVVNDGYIVIKEPNGSMGAPLLMDALPESRMITLLRDPRDVIASFVDADREGGWLNKHRGRSLKGARASDPHAFIRNRANYYLSHVTNSKKAYDAHKGHKVLIKYEDLRTDTLETMKRIFTTLEIPVDMRELARVVEKHSWENIPEDKKGEGKFFRKASPQGWQEDLTPEQVEIVEKITRPLLEEFYPN